MTSWRLIWINSDLEVPIFLEPIVYFNFLCHLWYCWIFLNRLQSLKISMPAHLEHWDLAASNRWYANTHTLHNNFKTLQQYFQSDSPKDKINFYQQQRQCFIEQTYVQYKKVFKMKHYCWFIAVWWLSFNLYSYIKCKVK